MLPFFSKLEARISDIDSLLCIGLDPHPNDLQNSTGDDVKGFCFRMIESTVDLAAAYKPNAAFFEALGAEGIIALREVIKAIPDDIPVILDAKRGDIASTAQAYAQAAFKILETDAVTINPYLGKDSIEPFIVDPEKGVFLLCKTSNPGAKDLQDLHVTVGEMQRTGIYGSIRLYEHVARLAEAWNINDNIGLVVGATQPESLANVRKAAPNLWILAPGVGSQGGDLGAALQAGLRQDGLGMLIPVSRSISRSSDQHQTAMKIRDDINVHRSAIQTKTTPIKPAEISNRQSSIADGLLAAGCIKFGDFTLKSGLASPIYIDLRRLVGFPDLLTQVAKAYTVILGNLQFDHLGALPYAALPITSAISLQMGCSMVYPRKESKAYGTKAQVEGVFESGQKVVVIDDLISTGGSKFEGIEKLESANLLVDDVVVLIDRSLDRGAELFERGYNLHSVIRIGELLTYYEHQNRVDASLISRARTFLKE